MNEVEKAREQEKIMVLRPKEAAVLIGCSEYKILEMARRGEIPSYKVGNRRLFTLQAMRKWVADQEKRSLRILR